MRASGQVHADIRAAIGARRAKQPVARGTHAPAAAEELRWAGRARDALLGCCRLIAGGCDIARVTRHGVCVEHSNTGSAVRVVVA